MNSFKLLAISFLASLVILTPGCVKQSEYSKDKKKEKAFDLKPFEKRLLEEEKTIKEINKEKVEQVEPKIKIKKEKPAKKKAKIISKKKQEAEIDFLVQNVTGRPIYITCFSYIKKRPFTRWRWDKSAIYHLEDNDIVKVDVDTIPDEQERKNVYGYLGVFDTYEQTKDTTYELLDDTKKIDLDLLSNLKNQKIQVGVEKYGFKGEVLDYDFVPITDSVLKYPELDFVVENKTGKTLLVTCFVYQKKDDMPVWKYDKTPIRRISPNSYGVIDVDTISTKYERVYMRGYLGIFGTDEMEKAKKSTYEMLKPQNKIALGRLAALKNKKIVLEIEKYGTVGDFIDYSVKPIKKIDFEKAFK